jgi:hypothetical protein
VETQAAGTSRAAGRATATPRAPSSSPLPAPKPPKPATQTQVATPDLKLAAKGGVLLHVDLAAGARRLGGSALAQAYGQVGDESPDVDPRQLKAMWGAVQVRAGGRAGGGRGERARTSLSGKRGARAGRAARGGPSGALPEPRGSRSVPAHAASHPLAPAQTSYTPHPQALLERRAISAGHDISDGGIATTLLEMAFAGRPGPLGSLSVALLGRGTSYVPSLMNLTGPCLPLCPSLSLPQCTRTTPTRRLP